MADQPTQHDEDQPDDDEQRDDEPGELGHGTAPANRTADAPWPAAHTTSDGPDRPCHPWVGFQNAAPAADQR